MVMNETLQIIRNRYACRGFDGAPLKKEDVQNIVKAGLQAPSAMNEQPWKIVAITNKQFLEELDEKGMSLLKEQDDPRAYERMTKRGGQLFYNASAMFLVLTRPGKELDSGIVAQNMVLAAESLGLNTVYCGMARVPLETQPYKSMVGIDESGEWKFATSILVGYGNVDKEPHEVDVSKVVYLD